MPMIEVPVDSSAKYTAVNTDYIVSMYTSYDSQTVLELCAGGETSYSTVTMNFHDLLALINKKTAQ